MRLSATSLESYAGGDEMIRTLVAIDHDPKFVLSGH